MIHILARIKELEQVAHHLLKQKTAFPINDWTNAQQIVCKLWEKKWKNCFFFSSNRVYVEWWGSAQQQQQQNPLSMKCLLCSSLEYTYTVQVLAQALVSHAFHSTHTQTHTRTATTEAFQLNTLFDLYQFFNGMKSFIIFFPTHVYMAHKSYLWARKWNELMNCALVKDLKMFSFLVDSVRHRQEEKKRHKKNIHNTFKNKTFISIVKEKRKYTTQQHPQFRQQKKNIHFKHFKYTRYIIAMTWSEIKTKR